jgi:hypothetical protein
MIECGESVEAFGDFAECAVCWSDTRLTCATCGDPVCHNCEVCPNGCHARMPPLLTGWMSMPLALPAVARRAG